MIETIPETIHTRNINTGEGSVLIMMDGTTKIPLPITDPMTMPRQERKESLYAVEVGLEMWDIIVDVRH